jgi:hypothetical protein
MPQQSAEIFDCGFRIAEVGKAAFFELSAFSIALIPLRLKPCAGQLNY